AGNRSRARSRTPPPVPQSAHRRRAGAKRARAPCRARRGADVQADLPHPSPVERPFVAALARLITDRVRGNATSARDQRFAELSSLSLLPRAGAGRDGTGVVGVA